MKKIMLSCILALISIQSYAYDGWSGDYVIQSVRVFPNSSVYIKMPGAANPGNCSDLTYLVLANADTESGKRLYTAIMSAFVSGKTVTLAFTGCAGGGTTGNRLIEQVWVK